MSDEYDDWEAADDAGAFDQSLNGHGSPCQQEAAANGAAASEWSQEQAQRLAHDPTTYWRDNTPQIHNGNMGLIAPEIRILQRPNQSKSNGHSGRPHPASSANGGGPQAARAKTLAEREREYAEARRRILGD